MFVAWPKVDTAKSQSQSSKKRFGFSRQSSDHWHGWVNAKNQLQTWLVWTTAANAIVTKKWIPRALGMLHLCVMTASLYRPMRAGKTGGKTTSLPANNISSWEKGIAFERIDGNIFDLTSSLRHICYKTKLEYGMLRVRGHNFRPIRMGIARHFIEIFPRLYKWRPAPSLGSRLLFVLLTSSWNLTDLALRHFYTFFV